MGKNEILQKIKSEIFKLYPSAKIILYGSRARGDYREYSDWDFLIIIDKYLTEKQKLEIKYKLYDLELDIDEVLCSIIHSKQEWENLQITPFYKNVQKEGIEI